MPSTRSAKHKHSPTKCEFYKQTKLEEAYLFGNKAMLQPALKIPDIRESSIGQIKKLYIVQYTLYTVQVYCTVYIVHRTGILYSIHCTNVHCTGSLYRFIVECTVTLYKSL